MPFTKSELQAGNKERFYFLDGLRGVAAIFVCLYHFSSVCVNGWLAVDFFFMLSGFVIAHSYEQKLLSGMSLYSFLKIRLIRLYPLYFLVISCALIMSIYGYTDYRVSSHLIAYIFQVLLLPVPSNFQVSDAAPLFPFNVPAWSVYLELVVNIIYAGIVIKLTGRRLAILNIIFLVLLVCTVEKYNSLNVGIFSGDWQGGWIRALWGFFAGLSVYRLYSFLSMKQYKLPYWVGAILLLYLSAIYIYPQMLGIKFQLANAIIAFPLLVLIGSTIRMEGILKDLCEFFGKISYPVYLVQFLTFYLVLAIGDLAGVAGMEKWRLLATLLIAIFLAFAYDAPVRKYLTRKLK